MTSIFNDIINLPHHVSKHHPQMSMEDRATQFAPFAALNGHEDAIKQAGRQTDADFDYAPGEDTPEDLDRKISILQSCCNEAVPIAVTATTDKRQADTTANRQSRKIMVQTITGTLKAIDTYNQTLSLTNGMQIRIQSIVSIDSPIFGDCQ